MIQHPPSATHLPHASKRDGERSNRRVAATAVAVVLTASLGYIAWKLWVVETLRDRLERLPVIVETVDPLGAAVLALRVDGHQGPGESAYFDLFAQLEVRRGSGDGPALVRIGAMLEDDGNRQLLELEPVVLRLQPGETATAELTCSPLHKPIAERAHRLSIWVY